MKKQILLLCSLVVLIFCAAGFAEEVYLSNGDKVEGKVVSQDEEKVVVRIGEGSDATDVTFFTDEIKSIEESQPVEEPTSGIEYVISQGQPEETPQAPSLSQPAETKQEEAAPAEISTEILPVPEKAGETAEVKIETAIETAVTQAKAQLTSPAEPNSQGQIDQQQKMLEELTSLLDEQELAYFTNINSMVKDVINRAMQILVNPESLNQDANQLPQMMQDLSLDINGIIAKLNTVQAPALFVNFHNDYLDNLNLLKGMLVDMANGDITASQSKIGDLQNANMKIQQELSKVLAEKKNKAQGENANVTN